MKIAVLDDYQDVARSLPCFGKIAHHDVTVFNDHVDDPQVLATRLHDAEALLLIRERTPITAALLQRLPKLRLISQFGAVPHIDLAACSRQGVTVCSRVIPGRASHATAELTWGLMLAALRRIPQESHSLREGRWQSPAAVGRTLRGLSLGVFGYGRIGAVVAGYGRAFGMHVQVWGRAASLDRARADGFAVAASAPAFFAACDVISLHLALREGTHGIVTRELLSQMRTDSILVNTSRAGLIEEGALVEALKAGRPGRAAVDVFEHEPMTDPSHPLLQLPDVVATPHLGFVDRDSLQTMFDAMCDQVLAYERGQPIHVCHPAASS